MSKGFWLLVCALGTGILFAVLFAYIPVVFGTNDDRLIMEIVSGQFLGVPEGHAIQMTYPFTWFLSRLYLYIPGLNWYPVILTGIELLCIVLIEYRLQSIYEETGRKLAIIGAGLLVCMALYLVALVQLTYTATAAIAGMAALIWYGISDTNWKNIIITGILANLSFCIRPNVFYMVLPLAGILLLWKIKRSRKELYVLTILLATVGLYVVNGTAYGDESWKEFMAFFQQRTQIYDYYGLLPYDENEEFYSKLGVDREQYQIIKLYDYAILDDLPKDVFPKYIEAYKQYEKEHGIRSYNKAFAGVKRFILHAIHGNYGICNTVLFPAALFLFLWYLIKRKKKAAGYLFLSGLIILLEWLYLAYWDRVIERLTLSLGMFLMAVVVISLAWNSDKKQKIWTKVDKVAVVVFAIIMTAGSGWQIHKYHVDNLIRKNDYEDVQIIKEYCNEHEDEIFFMDIPTMTDLYGSVSWKAETPGYINYILLGDWLAYSPIYEKKLAAYQIDRIDQTMVNRDNVYTVIVYPYALEHIERYFGEDYVFSWGHTIYGTHGDAYAAYEIKEDN